ncbi:CDP-6-deoxy-delta-3,4-glucoseen reductase [Sulfurifustis variabilis]|uniref:CDP-6-deoxy-delta-3,4-glucoseen reductase n=1 Tax=Sulfurifustis variabilis TaxID=1675686 RepID=A0A1B4V215_9GAMM|nr:translesion DNA synthesis-associated protein ImuA [Sulfurifustis variabilis]BAU47325.1 CDP-6-deoxy-delta-3,4-glucoseen reductase [Sulfurifustis variabilis]
MNLSELLLRADVWRGGSAPPSPAEPTGLAVLDALLPGGGWPIGALTELVLARDGVGELRLLLPALARLSHGDRWVAFVAPPYVPYAPALAAAGVDLSRVLLVHPRREDQLWAVESSLRSGACAAVLAWIAQAEAASLRRLQLAAEAGGTVGVLFERRPLAGSIAALRLALEPAGAGAVNVHIMKRRGGWPVGPVRVEVDHALAVRAPAGPADRGLRPRRAHG